MEEGVVGQLDRLDARVRSGCADNHAGSLERLDVGGVEPVPAVVEALERLAAADLGEARARPGGNRAPLAVEGAREAADDGRDRVRVALA